MYNSGFRSKTRTPDGVGTVAAQVSFVQKSDPQPTILSWSIQGSDDRALDPAGGQTVVVAGAGFTSGMTVTVGSTAVGSVTIVSSTQATFTAPAKAAGNYTLTMANSNGQAAILVPGLAYSTVVTWSTSAGSLGDTVETTAFSESVVATADSSITYTLASGTLPTGATLNANGTITGTAVATASPTTYSFSVTATDAELQDSTQSFTITVNPDTVTWVSPANGTSYSLTGNQPMSNVTLSATASSGSGITYSANALPTGVSLSGNVISGTPTVAETVSTLLTATANTTTRYSTETITWTVTLGDTYWPYVSLLLNGSTPTTTFINDASLNNSQLTIVGDTKPNNFSPYENGYYSNYFDGTGDYLSAPSNTAFAFGTGDYTLEFWVYSTIAWSGTICLYNNNSGGYFLQYNTGTGLQTGVAGSSATGTYATTLTANAWNHIAVSRASGSSKCFVNGTQVGSTVSDTTNYAQNGAYIGALYNGTQTLTGYISNLRVVKGTALYTSNFTPSTSPLTAIANTSLLTCQSNRLIDNSVNNFAITKNGDTKVSPAIPFATPTTSSYNTRYSTYLDGTGDWLTAPDNASLDLGSSDFTIEGWFYQTGNLSTSSGGTGLVTKWTDAGNQRGWQFSVRNAAGTMTFYYSTTGSNFPVVTFNSVGLTLNTWTHLALVRTGNTLNLYKDGSLAGTSAFSSTIYDNTSPLAIGAWFGGTAGVPDTAAGNTLFQGVISNVRVVKGVAVYTGAFTPPTSPLTATQSSGTNISAITSGQTSLLTCQNATLIDNSTNALAITSNGDARPIATSPFTMTTSNTTVTSLGSTYFDGTGDYLSFPGVTIGTNAYTVECWFYISNFSTAYAFLGTSNSNALDLRINNSTTFAIDQQNVAQTTFTVPTMTVNTWYHVAFVRNASNQATVFLNGVQSSTGFVTMNTNYNALSNYIGLIGTNYFPGYIADFRVVNGTALYTSNFLPPQAPLTPITNTSLLTCQYNGGANNNGFLDQSSFNNIISRAGNTTQGTFSPYSQTGWSNYFNGSTDSFNTATLPAIALSANYTIEMWVNPTTLTANTTYWLMMYNNTGGSGGWGLTLAGQTGSATAKVGLWMVDFSVAKRTTTLTVPLGQWSHIAVVRNSGVNTIYVNGVADASTYSSSISILTNTVSVGYYSSSSNGYYNGYISNLRIVNGTAVYTSNFTPSTTPLTPITNTNLLTCQSNRFIDNSVNNYALTLAGTPSTQAFSPFGGVTSVPTSYSNYFDGTGDYLSVAHNSGFNIDGVNATIEAWVYPITSDAGFRGIITHGNTGSWTGWQLGIQSQKFAVETNSGGTTGIRLAGSTTITYNTWYHVALVKVSTTFNLYLNGVLDGTATSALSTDVSTNLNIGVDRQPTQFFTGYVSNARITKGQALYTTNFTPSTTPLTTTSQGATASNVSLLTCQSSTMIDNSPNYFAITANGDTKPYAYNPFGVTNTTQVSYTPSVNGGSMYFDGTGDNISLTSNPSLNIGSGNFTLEWWMYPTSLSGANQSLFFTGTGNLVVLMVSGTGVIQPGNYQNTGIVNPATGVKQNAWTHVAITRSGNVWNVYYNGVLAGTNSNYSFTPNTSSFTIGTGASPYFGYLSDYKLTPGAVLYTSNFYPGSAPATPTTTIGTTTYSSTLLVNGTSGGIIDYHSTNNLETVGNTQLSPQDPYAGSYYSNYFDGTGDYLTAGSTQTWTPSNSFTIEGWFNVGSIAASRCIFSKDANTSGSARGIVIYVNTSGGISVFYSTTGSSETSVSSSNSIVTVGNWYHLAFVKNSSSCTVYLNGVSVITFTSATIACPASPLNAIGSLGGAFLMLGYISNLRIVDGTAVYTSAFTPPTSPLTAISGTSLLTCQSNTFKDNSTNNFTITVNGDTKVQSQNPFQSNTGKSMYFDGTGDSSKILDNPNINLGAGDFTLECWAYFNAVNAEMTLINKGWQSSSAYASYLIYMTSAGSLRFNSSSNGGSWDIANEKVIGTMTSGVWTYVTVTRSGTTFRAFVNGVINNSFTFTSSAALANIAAQALFIGGRTDGSSSMNGYIKDLRITKGVARYTTSFTPPTTPDLTK